MTPVGRPQDWPGLISIGLPASWGHTGHLLKPRQWEGKNRKTTRGVHEVNAGPTATFVILKQGLGPSSRD